MASKGITLFSAATPNGYKISICLEELGLKYELKIVNTSLGEHKMPDFLKVNPNGRIPAIIDHDNDDLAVWESGAILLYLADKYGKGKLIPADDKGRSDVVAWLMWQMAGQGPMQGQCVFFTHLFPHKQPKTIERFVNEMNRLYGVLDEQLSKNEFVAGATYSIADIAVCGWAFFSLMGGIDIHAFPHVHKWMTAMRARPAVIKGQEPKATWEPMVKMLAAADDINLHKEVLADIQAKQQLTE